MDKEPCQALRSILEDEYQHNPLFRDAFDQLAAQWEQ